MTRPSRNISRSTSWRKRSYRSRSIGVSHDNARRTRSSSDHASPVFAYHTRTSPLRGASALAAGMLVARSASDKAAQSFLDRLLRFFRRPVGNRALGEVADVE